MTTAQRQEEIGIIGLGRMGGNLALQAIEKGIRVVGFTQGGVSDDFRKAGIVSIDSLEGFKNTLRAPRKIFLYVPAGKVVDDLIQGLIPVLNKGDIIVDAGNSYWGDSLHRYQQLNATGIQFVDCGTSGGIDGARHGACFMVGGESEPVLSLEPILRRLATPGGYVHAGPPSAGHFTKLVHNGIEFGMLQAIGEGIDLLAHHRDQLDIANILSCWRNGSVIRSWLIDLMEESYRKQSLESIPSYVDDTGEVNWLVADAMRMEVAIPVIAEAVMQLLASRDSEKIWAKAIAMMRHGFGGHAYGPNESSRVERLRGRVEEFSPENSRVKTRAS
jgi:6-phosphogluconate dehydrogenase